MPDAPPRPAPGAVRAIHLGVAVATRDRAGLVVEITRFLGGYSDPGTGHIITYPEATVHSTDIQLEGRTVGGRLRRSAESLVVAFFDVTALPYGVVASSRAPLRDLLQEPCGSPRLP